MFDKTIEELITEHISFVHGKNSHGYYLHFCELCGSGDHSKGPRSGWNFDVIPDGVIFNCFNCGVKTTFDPHREHPFQKNMIDVLKAHNIPIDECYAIRFKFSDNKSSTVKIAKPKIEIPIIEIPDYFYKLSDGDKNNIIVQNAYAHLEYRNINPDSYTFYLSNGRTKGGPRDEAIAKSLMNRLIIPFYNTNGEMIYYQGRALDKDVKKKYINSDLSRTNIIYGMDKLYNDVDRPLFVCEGFFDAYHLKGVSVQENSLTAGQIEILRKSPRKKVWVPDRKSDSSKAVDQFIKQRWAISVPDIGTSCKDIDDSVRRYGKFYTIQQVASNIYDDAEMGKSMMQMSGFLIK